MRMQTRGGTPVCLDQGDVMKRKIDKNIQKLRDRPKEVEAMKSSQIQIEARPDYVHRNRKPETDPVILKLQRLVAELENDPGPVVLLPAKELNRRVGKGEKAPAIRPPRKS